MNGQFHQDDVWVWALKTILTGPHFTWSVCTKPEKWAIIFELIRQWGIFFVPFILYASFNNSEHRELYSNMGMRMQHTIFLMMRLKSFRPEVDKSWQSRREYQKLKKKSPINDFKTKMISWTSKNRI